MAVNLSFQIQLDDNEKNSLKNILGCDDDELQKALTRIAKAALNEYLEMLLGRQLPTRAAEIRERRLFHLLKHYFIDRIPSESEISSMFQLTEASSCTLLRNVRAKFRFDLERELENTVRSILTTAKKRDGEYRVVIGSENILEELKRVVAARAPHLGQISKVRNLAGVYCIPEDTFDELCKHYRISPSEIEAAAAED